ncbi:Hypothetical protein CINCED_3A002967 [Cinara cedri]|uniref:Uncharacterized protein n=1 Tax=Cinara cedri TaxID=506608 RepID=A0A5E4N7B5_9HEMI|nr:Hypothetical protein CINCED_3A002967 [Cinara cedri]
MVCNIQGLSLLGTTKLQTAAVVSSVECAAFVTDSPSTTTLKSECKQFNVGLLMPRLHSAHFRSSGQSRQHGSGQREYVNMSLALTTLLALSLFDAPVNSGKSSSACGDLTGTYKFAPISRAM